MKSFTEKEGNKMDLNKILEGQLLLNKDYEWQKYILDKKSSHLLKRKGIEALNKEQKLSDGSPVDTIIKHSHTNYTFRQIH